MIPYSEGIMLPKTPDLYREENEIGLSESLHVHKHSTSGNCPYQDSLSSTLVAINIQLVVQSIFTYVSLTSSDSPGLCKITLDRWAKQGNG